MLTPGGDRVAQWSEDFAMTHPPLQMLAPCDQKEDPATPQSHHAVPSECASLAAADSPFTPVHAAIANLSSYCYTSAPTAA